MHVYLMYAPYAAENKPLRIVEYDENRNPYCEYKGYYRARSQTFVLYPVSGKFVNREERKKTVSDSIVYQADKYKKIHNWR